MPASTRPALRFWLKTAATVLVLSVAFMMGGRRQSDQLTPAFQRIFTGASRFEPQNGITLAYRDDRLLGLLATGSAMGYGGKVVTLVAADSTGDLLAIRIISQTETPAFYYRVSRHRQYRRFTDKQLTDAWQPGIDVQHISGATYTSEAYIKGIRQACAKINAHLTGTAMPEEAAPPWQWGLPEWTMLLLIILGILARGPLKKQAKLIRYACLSGGLIMLGFVINQPLTISWISRILMGQFPPLPTHLYWYMLMSSLVVITLFTGHNPYCEWFCPFGAAQEGLAMVGGGRKRLPRRIDSILKGLLAVASLGAVASALWLRNPAWSSYEIFGTLFRLIGATWQFAMLAAVMLAALFIRRPWCRYLCPLRPVTNSLKALRRQFSISRPVHKQ